MLANLLVAWSDLLESTTKFLTEFSVLFAAEILVLFTIIFFASKVLRDNDATKLMLLYWVLILVGGALNIFAQELVDKRFFLFFVIILHLC